MIISKKKDELRTHDTLQISQYDKLPIFYNCGMSGAGGLYGRAVQWRHRVVKIYL